MPKINEKRLESTLRKRYAIAKTSAFTIAKDIIDLTLFLIQQRLSKNNPSRKELEEILLSDVPNVWLGVEIETEHVPMRNDPTPIVVFYKIDIVQKIFKRVFEIPEKSFAASLW